MVSGIPVLTLLRALVWYMESDFWPNVYACRRPAHMDASHQLSTYCKILIQNRLESCWWGRERRLSFRLNHITMCLYVFTFLFFFKVNGYPSKIYTIKCLSTWNMAENATSIKNNVLSQMCLLFHNYKGLCIA